MWNLNDIKHTRRLLFFLPPIDAVALWMVQMRHDIIAIYFLKKDRKTHSHPIARLVIRTCAVYVCAENIIEQNAIQGERATTNHRVKTQSLRIHRAATRRYVDSAAVVYRVN